MKHDVGLAALIVNYNTGSYAEAAAASLIREWEREGRDRAKLRVVCVDNASPLDQDAHLAALEALGVTVVRAAENLGYARGMNLAYEQVPPAEDPAREAVAILNPDLYFLPGALGTLLDYLFDHPECGCVDPATSIDTLGVLQLPRNLLPTPAEQWRVNLAQMSPLLCRAYSRYRLARALPWWTSPEPLETDMLSGCCVFLRRELVERMGRVMDPRYPLYFEDTDLFRTIRGMGLTVVHHTGARVLHHWSRSAKVGAEFDDEPQRRHDVSRRAYYEKFYGPLGRASANLADRVLARWPKRKLGRPMVPLEDLGVFEEPFELVLPRSCRYLIEISVQPTFLVCGGILGEGDRWVCPPEAWEWLFRFEYYLRAIDLDTRESLGAWRFVKSSEGRDHALSPQEVEAAGERLFSRSTA